MRIKKYAALLTIIVLGIFVATGFLACNAQPVAEKPNIKIGYSIPLTGKAAEKGKPIWNGQSDAAKYINDELGGVEGYKIETVWYDTGYDTAKAASIVNKLMDDKCLFFVVVSSLEANASKEAANKGGFPGLICFSSPTLTQPPMHMYAQLPDYGDDWAAFAKYYMDNVWKGEGKPKMALMMLNNPTGYGARDAADAMAENLGIEIVAKEEHTATTISETDALIRIQATNPDIIFISSTPQPTAVILKNANELKMLPKIKFACAHASFTKALVDLAGKDTEGNSICNGIYGVYPTVSWDDKVPGIDKMIEYCKTLHPNDYGNNDYIVGWTSTLVAAEIAKQAILNSADPAVLLQGNEESWKLVEQNGFLKVKGYDVGGLHGPVDFSNPADKRGSKSVRIFQVENGVIIPISDWVDAPFIDYSKK